MSENKGKNILVLAGIFDGHIPGIFEIIKDLKSLGHNITCYVLDKYEERLKMTNVKLIPYSTGKIEIPPGLPKVALLNFHFTKCIEEILSLAVKSEQKYDYLLYDSLFDGNEINKIFKIPKIVAIYVFPVGEMSPFMKNTVDKRMLALIPINKKYNLNLRDFITIHHRGEAKYKLILTSRLFHIETKIVDNTFYFIGPSIDKRPIDNSFNFKKDENKKLIYISLGTVFNENFNFYQICIETFGNLKEFQIIISIGNNIKVNDLGQLPDNIYAFNYVPQLQVLKMTDIFITHGGINSINEGIFMNNNLSFIVIPQEMDQFDNAKQIEKLGAGIALDIKNINQEILKNAVFEILENPDKYRKGIEMIMKSFKEAREERKAIYEKIFV